jgi:membrane protease YdiL (CAAX protease family)
MSGAWSGSDRRTITTELVIVFTITLGLSGLRSLLSLVNALLEPRPLAEQQVALNVSRSARSLIDLAFQLVGALQLVAWGALGVYLLLRVGTRLADIGLDNRWRHDLPRGVVLAAVIGIPGLGLYLISHALGASLTVLPSTLTAAWWRLPILVLSAAANAWAEEVLVVGYLLTRLNQRGTRRRTALVISSLLRGTYHLYQGFGAFVGNLVMGLLFGAYWQRTGRLWPLVLAHTLLDTVAFVGYALLRGKLSWLP